MCAELLLLFWIKDGTASEPSLTSEAKIWLLSCSSAPRKGLRNTGTASGSPTVSNALAACKRTEGVASLSASIKREVADGLPIMPRMCATVSRIAGCLSRACASKIRSARSYSMPEPGRKRVRRRVLACAVRRGIGTTKGLPAHVLNAINSSRFSARRSSSRDETATTARGSFSIIQYNKRQAAPRRPSAASRASAWGGTSPTGGATSAAACSRGKGSSAVVRGFRDEESDVLIIHAPSEGQGPRFGVANAGERSRWPLVF